MKKTVVIILALALIVGTLVCLTACGKGGEKGGAKAAILEIGFGEEQYGIAAAKGNDALISKINEGLIGIANGKMLEVADSYSLRTELLINSDTQNPKADATDGSWDKIVSKKKIVIGYTVFAPIAYTDENTKKFTGFDTEMARGVIKYLNDKYNTSISIEFTEIDWDTKVVNINAGQFDLIWNGMTITDEIRESLSVSLPYLKNRQAAVVRVADKNKYPDLDSLKNAIIGCEKGSAGNAAITENGLGKKVMTFDDQLSAYNQLLVGGVNVVIIDSIMAGFYISKG